MGRPAPLESRPGGPWYRGIKRSPHLGNRPRERNNKFQATSFDPRGLSRHFAHSLCLTRDQGHKTDKTRARTSNHTISQIRIATVADTHSGHGNPPEWFPGAAAGRRTGTGPHAFSIASDLRFAIPITNRNRNQIARFGPLKARWIRNNAAYQIQTLLMALFHGPSPPFQEALAVPTRILAIPDTLGGSCSVSIRLMNHLDNAFYNIIVMDSSPLQEHWNLHL